MNQVPEYLEIQTLRKEVEIAKKKYLLNLISLGYVFEKRGTYEYVTYWAIHKNYYKIPEDRIWDDNFDGTVTPDYFPVGAFMKINSIAESETDNPWEKVYFLDEDRCSLYYLK